MYIFPVCWTNMFTWRGVFGASLLYRKIIDTVFCIALDESDTTTT